MVDRRQLPILLADHVRQAPVRDAEDPLEIPDGIASGVHLAHEIGVFSIEMRRDPVFPVKGWVHWTLAAVA